VTAPLNPLDPFGLLRSWQEAGQQAQEAADRVVTQARQARRTAALAALLADVDAAYAAFKVHPDSESAANLIGAAEHYRGVAES